MQTVVRYHPLLVALHWLVALLIAASLFGGLTLLQQTPNSDPLKAVYLRMHMAGGLALAAVMLVRLATRLATRKPAPLGGRLQAGAALVVHWAIYLVIFAMLATGIGIAALAGLFPLLSGAQVALPPSFEAFPPHAGHELFSRVLMALILLHVLGAVWHWLAGDSIWGRMWFGKRS